MILAMTTVFKDSLANDANGPLPRVLPAGKRLLPHLAGR